MARAASLCLMILCLTPVTVFCQNRTPAPDVLVASAAPPATPVSGESHAVAPDRDLSVFLKSQGYIEIPLVLAKDGSLNVKVQVNGQPLDFVVDTGAGNSVLDTAVARRLNLPLKETPETLAGITGSAVLTRTVVDGLSLGPLQSREEPVVADLGPVNRERVKADTPACHGLLGNNVLQLHGAVIDHSSVKLFLVDPATIFNLQSVPNARSNLHLSVKDGRLMREVTVEFLDQRPRLVTAACCDALELGMTASRILEQIGGGLKEARMTPTYTGTLAVVQQSSRIDLVFQQGKLVSKSAHGLE